MIDIKRTLKSNRIMKALTGLSRKEFLKLVPIFGKHLGPVFLEKRNVQSNLGRKFVLKTNEQKLFYILLYVKCYPTFDLAAFMFNVDRSSCCRWTHWFIEVLERTLGKELVLPKRKVSSIEEFVELFPTLKKIYIDGTEIYSSDSYSDAIRTNSDQVLSIGATDWSGTQSYFFDCLIDEVKIYNYALTEEQIKMDYNQGAAVRF